MLISKILLDDQRRTAILTIIDFQVVIFSFGIKTVDGEQDIGVFISVSNQVFAIGTWRVLSRVVGGDNNSKSIFVGRIRTYESSGIFDDTCYL